LKELSAAVINFFHPNLPQDGLWQKAGNFYYDSWQEARILSEDFFYKSGNDPQKLILWGRFPFIILTLILGIFVYFWAKKLYGKKAGLFAGFLTLFFPNFLAHGILINTDVGLALFIFISVYFFGKYLKSSQLRTNWQNLVLCGLFTGLAFASKFTSGFLIPIYLVLIIINVILSKNIKIFFKFFCGLILILTIGFLVVWMAYFFSFKIPPDPNLAENVSLWSGYNLSSSLQMAIEKNRIMLFPAEYYKGIFLVFRHAVSGHGSFLLGQTSNYGWWYYFPVAILYKTPIPIFVWLILSFFYFKKIRSKNIFDEYLLIIPIIVFLGLSMFSKANLGLRHILPIFPFVFIFISKSINLVDFKTIKFMRVQKKVLIPALGFLILILWYLFSSVVTYPNYIAYFNEFAGGQKNYYKILVDSNLDWGQDAFRIKNYLDKNNIKTGYIFYPWNGDSALEYYNINLQPLPWDGQGVKGKVVISSTYLQLFGFDWLRKYPFEQITPGVFIFNVN